MTCHSDIMNVSDKVVCIDDDWTKCHDDPKKYFSDLPVRGQMYVVESVSTANNGEVQINLVGIKARNIGLGIAGFYPHRFRILLQRKAINDRAHKAVNEKGKP